MPKMIPSVTGHNNVGTFGSLQNVYNVGHCDDSGSFIKQRIVLNLKIFPFANGFINRVSFQHKRKFDSHIETDNIVVLT